MAQLNTEILGFSVYDIYKAGRKWGKSRTKLIEEKGKKKKQPKRDWKKERGEVTVIEESGSGNIKATGGSKRSRAAAIRDDLKRRSKLQGEPGGHQTKTIPPEKMRSGGSEWKGGHKGEILGNEQDYSLHGSSQYKIGDQDKNVRPGEQRAAGYIGGGRTATGSKVFGEKKEDKKTDEEKEKIMNFNLHLEKLTEKLGLGSKKKKTKKKKPESKGDKTEETNTDLGSVEGDTPFKPTEEEDSSYDVYSEDPDGEKKASMGVGKAEEGVGGMLMGANRGLGHEAGNIQGSGESTQVTEVKEEKEKSAYENHEQDESPDSQPNKQQIPYSKTGMDAIKSRANLIKVKYKNIYKLGNL